MNKLVGKKLTDSSSDTTVRFFFSRLMIVAGGADEDGKKSFAKQDLPKEHRVIEHGSMVTQDSKPDR